MMVVIMIDLPLIPLGKCRDLNYKHTLQWSDAAARRCLRMLAKRRLIVHSNVVVNPLPCLSHCILFANNLLTLMPF